jgi:hypothetical protein
MAEILMTKTNLLKQTLLPMWGCGVPYNGAEMRIWVEKNVSHGGRREHREDINYYGIKSKGI